MIDLKIAGNVQTVLNGEVSKETMFPFSLNQMAYALGGAAIPSTYDISLGETVVYENVGHIFTKDKSHVERSSFDAAFLMGIERRPKEALYIEQKQTIHALYQALMKQYQRGFAIVGKAFFSKLSVAYLKLSPIYGENINELHDKYWAHEIFNDHEAKLFGVALVSPDPRAFYNNPNERKIHALCSHTHALIPQARHLLTDSEILKGEFWVEEISCCKIVG